jgi:polyhydroxyalkanoate synthesis regulator phasin
MGRPVGGPIEQTEETTKRLFYAWLGALATAYDTAEEQFDTFVRRGRQVADEWQGRKGEPRSTMRPNARVRDSFRVVMDSMMEGMNVPTKAEIDAMNVKLNILMRKLDDLTAQTAQTTSAPGRPDVPPSSTTPPMGDTDLAT